MGKSQSKSLSQETISKLSSSTSFPLKELKSWYKGFLKDCPSGSLSKKDFIKLYKQFYPFGDPSKYAHYLFNHLDLDKNGELDFVEFMIALEKSGRGSFEEKVEWVFGLYDLDEDGVISRAEMFCIVDSVYRLIGSALELESDEDTAEKRVDKIFRLFDENNDGVISKSEFIKGANQDPLILESLNLYSGLL